MIIRNSSRRFLILALTMVLFLSAPFCMFAQTAYFQHTVEAQETLYGIARRFNTTIDEVLAANPGLTAQNLKRGQVIRIPAKTESQGYVPAKPTSAYRKHVVQQSETVWGIAHQYGISIEALRAANPEMNTSDYVLPIGATLNIPFSASSSASPASSATVPAQANGLRVALVMPLKAQRAEVPRCVEFYQGMLIAAEEMRQKGHSITLYTYEEDPNDASLSDLQSKLRNNPVEIIYGPLYPAHFPVLASFAHSKGIRLIVPFSSKVAEVEKNPSVYVVNTPETYRNRAAAEVLARQFGRTHLVVLKTASGNESAFVSVLKSKLGAQGATSTTLPVDFSDQQLLQVFALYDRVLFLPDGSDEAAYRSVIRRLDRLRGDMPLLSTSLIAYPDWQKYQDEDRMKWYACDTYVFCPSFYNPYDDFVKIFVRKYRDRYGADLLPYYPRYGALGYDLGLQTMTGYITHGRNYKGQEARGIEGVQSHLKFEPTKSGGGYANTNIWLMHFKKDRTIQRIGVR